MAIKFYTAEKEINGKKYVAQFNGFSATMKALADTYIPGTNITSPEKMLNYVLENVIVEPKGLTADDFDSFDELQEVSVFGQEVMQGEFRPPEDKGAAKK